MNEPLTLFLPKIAANVKRATDAGAPVVALETVVVAHGLPFPENIETALAMEARVSDAGATPATVGVVRGTATVGMTADEIEDFARSSAVLKLARRDIGFAVAMKKDGATTVGATIALARMANVQIMATGGVGGVHRGAETSWDVSGDLVELARNQVLVVCAGAKAILNLPATLEYLETAGVPVIGFQSEEFPGFYTARTGIKLDRVASDEREAAAIWRAHCAYGGGTGMVVAVAPPVASEARLSHVAVAVEQALREASAADVGGQRVTPFLLHRVSELTGGESRRANIDLLLNNASVAARIARHAAA
jgi:pseudouridine-5'-phosphate glycosidase